MESLLFCKPWTAHWPREKRDRLSELKFRQWWKNEGEERALSLADSTPLNLESIREASNMLLSFKGDI